MRSGDRSDGVSLLPVSQPADSDPDRGWEPRISLSAIQRYGAPAARRRCWTISTFQRAPFDGCATPEDAMGDKLVAAREVFVDADQRGQRGQQLARQACSWVVPCDFHWPKGGLFERIGHMFTTGTAYANTQNKHSAPGICTHSGASLFKLFRATGDRWLLDSRKSETPGHFTQSRARASALRATNRRAARPPAIGRPFFRPLAPDRDRQ